MLTILVAIALGSLDIELWKGGDDGLTNRFFNAFEAEITSLKARPTEPLKITVEQIEPKQRKRLGDPVDAADVTIRFERRGKSLKSLRCTFYNDDFESCVTRAVGVAKRLADLGE